MTCPSCGAELRGGSPRCAVCDALVAPLSEGALAPKPAPLRELPGARKKEKTWREEVNERVRSRKKKREDETGLPLFDQPVLADEPAREVGEPPSPAPPRLEDAVIARSVEAAVDDLPLRPAPDVATPAVSSPPPRGEAEQSEGRLPRADEAEARGEDDEWRLELEPPAPEPRPVERPALFAERARAGAVDLALFSIMGLIVVYFASRAARVPLTGLLPAWPWLGGYLAFLGLAYATYFTGTTGQTLGKMLFDLRVVDTAGQPPGYLRAFLRAAFGAVSCVAAGLGVLPMAFDPARRCLHDRALRTRVVRG